MAINMNFYTRSRLFHVLLAGLVLFGCGSAPPSTPAGSVMANFQSPRSEHAFLVYFDQLRQLSSTELAKEVDRVRKNYAKDKSPFYQMQYAVVLSVPGGDARHALQLLEPLVNDTRRRDHSLYFLAALLYAEAVERVWLESQAQAQASQLQAHATALQAQTLRADELQNKLDALKNIERKMMQRETLSKP